MDNREVVKNGFHQRFNSVPETLCHAPGRVNLIGEHTDYNHGFVFPAAINYGTWIAASKRDDNDVLAVALNYEGAENQFSIDDIHHDDNTGWSNYIRGVVKVLRQDYPNIGGINMVISGNVPQGAGLSSSASFEIAILAVFKELFELNLDGITAAKLGQKAENTFVGCSCGIMDQLISAMGKEGHAMKLDCDSLTFEHTTLPASLNILIINSNVKRGLVDSEYNLRRQQCEAAAKVMGVQNLRGADMAMLEEYKAKMDEIVYRRARHILTDNQRTHDMFAALKNNDIEAVSDAMAASHISMRDDFEITVPAIDTLVEIIDDVLGKQGGVRMTGGGFGGCVVALVPDLLVKKVEDAVNKHYHARTGYKQNIYICSAEQGAFA